jgi:hypothetical protein
MPAWATAEKVWLRVSRPIALSPARLGTASAGFCDVAKAAAGSRASVREWNHPLFVAFADDGEEVIEAISGRDLKAHRLAGSQTAPARAR